MTARLLHRVLLFVGMALAMVQVSLAIAIGTQMLTSDERVEHTHYISYWLLLCSAWQGVSYAVVVYASSSTLVLTQSIMFNWAMTLRSCFIGASSEVVFFGAVLIQQIVYGTLISLDTELFQGIRDFPEEHPKMTAANAHPALVAIAWLYVVVLFAQSVVVVVDVLKRGGGRRNWLLPFGQADDGTRALPVKYDKYERRGPHPPNGTHNNHEQQHGMVQRLSSKASDEENGISYQPTKSTM